MKPSDDFTCRRRFESVRKRSEALAAPLSDEDCGAQSMPDASPVKWHLAHTTWFFETFILEQMEERFQPFHPTFRFLFNSYYNGIGDRHPRAKRGLLTRPSMAEVRAYRADVDERIGRLLAAQADNPQLAALIELGLQHEQQHQELILTDVQHLLAQNALNPAYTLAAPAPAEATPLRFLDFAGGVAQIGHAGDGFCFDNELPRHRQFVEPFALADRLVTNGEYLAFIDAGGYRDAALWLSEGWDQVNALALAQPMYWQRDEAGRWCEFTLHGLRPLDLARPVTSVSLFEADAYANWRGARLPTEFEWELAEGQGEALRQMFGHCWQWTSSSYAPYPGYATAPGALGEYNGKFMLNQYVLRGSSSATPAGHSRATYRNFFPAGARWQFTGIRLAK
ncbi:ergothioneine biosynthesis protein EgtB [Massilia sp. R2A-15]|uniref:ergothioneine biosynthesis protein EgtB n=1 Tax=Massilia sp. R2A-15 TaxID=3064278 RepID=UPI002735CB40|nr:ergothioneine biosynthesis protein EgtB [Massilia sp. R2A-15]WLI90579.1 ergothioneine biosynthesis protein EgtB [Massilia sp. R2A-15]